MIHFQLTLSLPKDHAFVYLLDHLFAQLHIHFVIRFLLFFDKTSLNSVVTLFPASAERDPFSQIFGPCLKGCVVHELLLCV